MKIMIEVVRLLLGLAMQDSFENYSNITRDELVNFKHNLCVEIDLLICVADEGGDKK